MVRRLAPALLVACAGGGEDAVVADATADVADAAVEGSTDAVDAVEAEAPTPSECWSAGAWVASAAFADAGHVSHPLPSFARAGVYYVHTMNVAGSGDRVLQAARVGADGALSPWFAASPDHGGGPHGYTAIVVDGEAFHFRNGHIARYPFDAAGKMTGDVVLLEKSTSTSFGGAQFVWDTAVYAPFASGAKWAFHLGGFSFTPYAYRPEVSRSAVPIGSAFSAPLGKHPAARPGKSVFVAGKTGGFVFTGESAASSLFRAAAQADGALDAWTPVGPLPAGTGNERGDLFVKGRTLFTVRGAKVFATDVAADGKLGAWTAMPSLPEDQIDVGWGDGHLEGAAWGLVGDVALLTGPKRVFSTRLVGRPCAN
ncbi:MAG: hypothetical protein IPJ34_35140 [Myxococcales bacterium]|nr:hypothetical protein [Myxococcales bacterium]